MTALAPTLQAFFTERLITQRNASPHTIAAYRDTFRLLLTLRPRADRQTAVPAGHRRPRRAADRRVPRPSRSRHGATAPGLATPGSGQSTRSTGSPRSSIPSTPHTIAGCMAIPTKRHERNIVSYLDLDEIKALLAAPDRGHLARPARPRAARARDPDRRARLRAHRPDASATCTSAPAPTSA